MLRKHLRQLGHEPERHIYTFEPPKDPPQSTGDHQAMENPEAAPYSQIMHKRANPQRIEWQRLMVDTSSSSHKRKREDVENLNHYGDSDAARLYPRTSSRDLMPPPLPKLFPKEQAYQVHISERNGGQNPLDQSRSTDNAGSGRRDSKLSMLQHDKRDTGIPCRIAGSPRSRHGLVTVSRPSEIVQVSKTGTTGRSYDPAHRTQSETGILQDVAGFQPFSKLSINSPTSRSNFPSRPTNRQKTAAPQYFGSYPSGAPGASMFDRFAAPVAPSQHYHPFDLRLHMFDGFQAPSKSSSPHKQVQESPGPSRSPFFKRNMMNMRTPNKLRPVTKGTMSAAGQHYQTYNTASSSPSRLPNRRDVDQRQMPSSSISRRCREIDSSRSEFHCPVQREGPVEIFQRHSQSSFDTPRLDGALPRRQLDGQQPRHMASRNHGRITLPPSDRRFVHPRGMQDTALSSIPGVRGLPSQSGLSRPRVEGI